MSVVSMRRASTHVDGTPIFQTPEDRANEQRVADVLERAWGCRLRRFGALSPVDWYAERNGRVVGFVEAKVRTHSVDRFPTVFVAVRKVLALQLAATMFGAPPVFVAMFACGAVRWVNVHALAGARIEVTGRAARLGRSDIEPLVHVPIADMEPLEVPA